MQIVRNQFQKGSGLYTCRCCKRNTRDTGGDGASRKMCDLCWELAGEENSLQDEGCFYESPEWVLQAIATIEDRGGDVSKWADLRAAANKLSGEAQ